MNINELAWCSHDDQGTWFENDARGLCLAKVCPKCVDYKLSQYRPEVLTNPSYACDEPIEPDE